MSLTENEQANAPQEPDFKSIVEQSKIKLHEETPIDVKPKRGPGNPGGKRGKYQKRGVKSLHMVRDDEPQSENMHQNSAEVMPMPELTDALAFPVKLLGRIPAQKYKIEELALSDEESREIAKCLDALARIYVPDLTKMTPAAAAWFNLGSVSVTLLITKFQIYAAKMAEQKATEKEPEIDTVAEVAGQKVETPNLHADNYFRREHVGQQRVQNHG